MLFRSLRDEFPFVELGRDDEFRERLGLLRRCDDNRARLDDARLRSGDVGDGRSEEFLVIEPDGRENSDVGVGDVRRIPFAAHPDLEDGDVDGREVRRNKDEPGRHDKAYYGKEGGSGGWGNVQHCCWCNDPNWFTD